MAADTSGQQYDRHYFDKSLGPVPYDRTHPEWLEFFGTIAEHIASDIKPKRVLDVGCAKGFLVEALRDRGIEAWGIDISDYAIGEVREDIRPFCRVGSVLDLTADDAYDLIVCIEVLEHLDEADGRRAIAAICESTTDVLFSSSPDDFTEPTHLNVRARSWWIDRFAERGLQLDTGFDAGFIAPQAMRFKAGVSGTSLLDSLLIQRHDLLRELAAGRADKQTLESQRERLRGDFAAVQRGAEALRNELVARRGELAALQEQVGELRTTCADLSREKDRLAAEVAPLQSEVAGLRRGAADKDRLIAGLNFHLLAIQRTIGWKVLQRLRHIRDSLLPADSRRLDLYWRIRRPFEVLLDEGIRSFVEKTRYKIRLRWRGQEFLIKPPPPAVVTNRDLQYQFWIDRHRLTAQDLADMHATSQSFSYQPVISIITPVYNTDEMWLRKAIDSVRNQAYPRWELCLVNDGSDKPHVRPVLDEYVALDPRIWAKHLPRNLGIARASGHALSLATGDFVALLDHDDELPPEALFCIVELLNQHPDTDLIYTDEDKLDADGQRVEPFFKPDWSPDLLMSMNYITHLSCFRRSQLEEIGGFRQRLDGSQDYDLLLRFTERARRIAHLPKILYHWRKVPGSAAASTAAKPFAYEAARQALEDAVKRRGRDARVSNVLPGVYAVRYSIVGTPLVSIIIPTRDRWPLLQQCLQSIEEKTRYPRYEIIILDNDSCEPDSMRGLNAVADKWRVLPYPGPFNFAALNNFGAGHARGDYFVFLNNDTQVLEPDWLGAMLEHAQRPEVGAVGARLHYPDGRIQHAGLVLGVGGVADHAFKGVRGDTMTYFGLGEVVRNVSAVTGACMMVSRRVFHEVGGFDERLHVALNDVDLCLRLGQRGYLIVYTPFALLYHHESGTRGRLHPPADEELVWNQWGQLIRQGDPYYNVNLTLSRTDWTVG